MITSKILWINVAVKVALVGLLMFAVANPDREQCRILTSSIFLLFCLF